MNEVSTQSKTTENKRNWNNKISNNITRYFCFICGGPNNKINIGRQPWRCSKIRRQTSNQKKKM